MNFLSHNRPGKHDPNTPRLIPTDKYPAEDIPGLPRPDAADSDLSFEDALADLQFSRFLHSEYDVQAPAESYKRVAMAIEAGKQPQPAPKPERASRLAGAALLGGGLLSSLSRPAAARIASGIVAVMVMAAALVPNVSMVLQDSAPDSHPSTQIRGVGDYTSPPEQTSLPATQSTYYDKIAVLRNDPPDTLAPPQRNPDSESEHQIPGIGGPYVLLRKE